MHIIMHGTYVGARDDLVGQEAQLAPGINACVMARFYDKALPRELTDEWSPFAAEEFTIHKDDKK